MRVLERSNRAYRVDLFHTLDPDHGGAIIREVTCRGRPRIHPGKIEHLQSLQRGRESAVRPGGEPHRLARFAEDLLGMFSQQWRSATVLNWSLAEFGERPGVRYLAARLRMVDLCPEIARLKLL